MKTYYDLIGIQPAAEADEVKRAFRREIARYHPDKVHHLGVEFQEIAAARAAALTEAYRVLMDAQLRQRYDAALLDESADGQRVAAAAVQPSVAPSDSATVPTPGLTPARQAIRPTQSVSCAARYPRD